MGSNDKNRMWRLWLLCLPAILIFTFFLSGILYLFVQSFWHFESSKRMAVPAFELTNYQRFLGDPFYYEFLWRSFKISAIVTISCILMAYPVAYCIARTRKMAVKRLLLIAVVITALIGVVNRSYAWLILLGTEGPINKLLLAMHLDYDLVVNSVRQAFGYESLNLGASWPMLFNEFGVCIGLIHRLLPFMIIFLNIAIENIDPALEYASRSLGASKVYTFKNVTLPLSLNGVAAGALFVFGLCCSDYVMPELLGGSRIHTMSNKIKIYSLEVMNYPFGSAIAFIMLFAILLLALALYLLLRSMRHTAQKDAHV
jgi:putative spermidine/putrescine transport system permease protein